MFVIYGYGNDDAIATCAIGLSNHGWGLWPSTKAYKFDGEAEARCVLKTFQEANPRIGRYVRLTVVAQ